MSGTGSRTVASQQTKTFAEQVHRVTRSVQSDLLTITDTYGTMDSEYVVEVIHDFRILLNDKYLSHIELLWFYKGTNTVAGGYKYVASNGEAVRISNEAGQIPYDPVLANCTFSIKIFYSAAWKRLSLDTQNTIRMTLKRQWSTVPRADYSRGSYAADASYGESLVGLSRETFKRK